MRASVATENTKSPVARIVFWEPCLSPHKHAFFAALAGVTGMEVVCCAHEDIPSSRRALGWTLDPAWQGVRSIVAPSDDTIDSIVSGRIAESLHIFSGIHRPSTIHKGLAAARRHGAAFGIYAEPRDDEGMVGFMRRIHSLATEGGVRRNARFVLAIGRNGPPWFLNAGYSASRIHPFAYFLQRPPSLEFTRENASLLHVCFGGRITRTTGVFDLIEAVSLLPDKNQIVLTMVGSGDGVSAAATLARIRGLRLEMPGVMPISGVWKIMANEDVLVLPSLTKDGWGAVVSEGLMCGCAVITTSFVGASVVLDSAERGQVVSRHAPSEIASAIQALAQSASFTQKARERRASWARHHLDADAGARHLMAIIDHHYSGAPRPMPFYVDPSAQ
jgi:glycosyltransferase involved in cell wall biosynthesis